MDYLSTSPKDTQNLGAALGKILKPGDTVLMAADLGAGKTTFAQGLVRALGIKDHALSPTFIIAQTYEGKKRVHHLDFYRLSKKEILEMGVQDYFTGGGAVGPGILLVEWADRFPELWPPDHLLVQIKIDRGANRRLTITAKGPRSIAMLKRLPPRVTGRHGGVK